MMKEENEKFCHECGEKINVKAEICPKCGVRQPYFATKTAEQQQSENRWIITLLLCWFLGVFGIHRFYTGHTTIGIIQLLTLGGCGIWVLVDFIMIIAGNFKDADGNLIKNY
jgi:TM2 domain-containing membrane protein YozV